MRTPTSISKRGAEARMRSGAAARLAGISASTLRIWEYRYGVVVPPRSASGQRNYSIKDIERLRLIKRLTAQGHAISTLAHLGVDALQALSFELQPVGAGVKKVFVVGHAAVRKLEGRLPDESALVFEDLLEAEREADHAGLVDALVIHVGTLNAALIERFIALRKKLAARWAIVVYSFGADAFHESLQAAGVTVRREPLSGKELVGLIHALGPVDRTFADAVRSDARRYSDADLIALAELSSPVSCECPRHLAEIVTLLAAFEQYSSECSSKNQKDTLLHQYLLEATGDARATMERALARVVEEEGLSHLFSNSP